MAPNSHFKKKWNYLQWETKLPGKKLKFQKLSGKLTEKTILEVAPEAEVETVALPEIHHKTINLQNKNFRFEPVAETAALPEIHLKIINQQNKNFIQGFLALCEFH